MDKLPVAIQKYKVKDIQLNVAEVGSGPSLVFVHGWSNNWIGWTRLAQELSANYTLHMIDLPGFGDSDPLERYSLEILADYVCEYVTTYVPKAEALIGGSMGTLVLIEAMRKCHLDTKLILIGTVFRRNKIKILAELYYTVLLFSSKSSSVQAIFEDFIRHPYSAYFTEKYLNAYKFNKQLVDTYQIPGRKKATGKSYVQIGASMMHYPAEEYIKQLHAEILLVFGSSDKYVSRDVAQKIVSELDKKNISIQFVDYAGHSPAYEQPEQTAQLIENFLKTEVTPKKE